MRNENSSLNLSSISDDRLVLVTGEPEYSDEYHQQGGVVVRRYVDGVWMTDTDLIVSNQPRTAAKFGAQVLLDGTGNLLTVLSHHVNNYGIIEKAIDAFEYVGNKWIQIGRTINMVTDSTTITTEDIVTDNGVVSINYHPIHLPVLQPLLPRYELELDKWFDIDEPLTLAILMQHINLLIR